MLRRRGVEVRTGQSVTEAMDGYVQLSTGEKVPTRSLIWCVGVRADPLVDGLDLETNRGRLVVDEYMAVPGAPDIYACGDCAAVPDLTRPGQVCGMTAQHAQRQGKQVARNVAASLGIGAAAPVSSTTTWASWSTWAGWPPPRTRWTSRCPGRRQRRRPRLPPGRHAGNRKRVLTDWTLNAVTPAEVASLAVISAESVPLDVEPATSLTSTRR